jgi:hypothetical protein
MPPVLQWLSAAIALSVFLGAVVVFLRGSKDKGTIETLGRNNDALTARVTILEAEDLRKTDQIEALVLANGVLQDTANSSAEIAELRAAFLLQLEAHHTQAMDGLAQLHADLTKISAALGGTS